MAKRFGSVRVRGKGFEASYITSGKRFRSPRLFDTESEAEEWLLIQSDRLTVKVTRRSNRFGNVQLLPSGKYRASYVHEGKRHYAPELFRQAADAGAWLSSAEVSVKSGSWIDPRAGRITFKAYTERWLAGRTDLRPRTLEQYKGLLKRNIYPTFGTMELATIKPSQVRNWHGTLKSARPTTAAQAYRLLRNIFNTAVEDRDVGANPCKIKKGGAEHAPERPVPTIADIESLTAAMPERLRLTVILAAWGGLRRGEVLGLQRRDFDASEGVVRVERALHELHDGSVIVGPPKSRAGIRMVHLPPHAVQAVTDHLDRFAGPRADSSFFLGPRAGKPVRPRDLETAFRKARAEVGLKSVRFHDLRHFNLTTFATLGATTREVMSRAGHTSTAAAIRYQHATEDRAKALTALMGDLISAGA